MIAATHNLFRDWLFYVATVSGMSFTWLGAYFRWIRPLQAEHRAHEAARHKQDGERTRWYDGETLPDGTIIDGAPEQLRGVKEKMEGVVAGQALLEKRMDEANGTGAKTLKAVKDLQGQVEGLVKHFDTETT